MKEDHVILSNDRVHIKEINRGDPKFWSKGPAYWFGCSCIDLVAAGWCTRKWLRFAQTISAIRNLSSGDLRILLVVIQLGVPRLKKTRACISSPIFLWGKGGEGAVWFSKWSANALMLVYVDVCWFMRGECVINLLGSWSFSKEWVWNLVC